MQDLWTKVAKQIPHGGDSKAYKQKDDMEEVGAGAKERRRETGDQTGNHNETRENDGMSE